MLFTYFLLIISFFDIRYHRIPNLFVGALFLLSILIYPHTWELRFLIFSSLGILIFSLVSKCGFGDIKLLFVILNFIVGKSNWLSYLGYLLLMSSISITLHFLHQRRLKGKIAFAPALCGAVLVLQP
jgi:prepilin peptidase CpaA